MGTRSGIAAFALALCATLLSCGPRGSSSASSPAEPASTAASQPSASDALPAAVIFYEGSPVLRRAGVETVLKLGDSLVEGDLLVTDSSSWVEIEVGDSSVIRILPGTTASLRTLRDASSVGWRSTEVAVTVGTILAKVSKLVGKDDFIVVTPNVAAGVRGTAFLVSVEKGESKAAGPGAARSRIAVRAGTVAVLPGGPLLEGLLDGRRLNPVAGAVVRTAFAFAPRVGAGKELSLEPSTEEVEEAEASYSQLLIAAERTSSAGFDLEEADDPTPFLAPEGSAASAALVAALRAYRAGALSSGATRTLYLLDSLRDPATGYEGYTVALPPVRAEKSAPEPDPALRWTTVVTKASFSDALTRVGDRVLAVDSRGTVHAVSSEGSILWSVPSEALSITALGDAIAVAAKNRLLLLDGNTGVARASYEYSFTPAASSSKPVAVPEGVAVVVPRGVAVLRSENASLLREIDVDGGVASPPVLADRELVCVTGKGALAFLDLSAGVVGATLPIALGGEPFAPRYRDGKVFVADRSGRIIAVSVQDRTVRWSRDLGAPLGSEVEVGDLRVFAWTTDRRLHTLAREDGAVAAPPIPGVSAPPLLSEGRLYWGTASGDLVVADGRSGEVLKRIRLARSVSIRPLMVGGTLYAGTSDGRVLKVDPNR